MLKQRFSFVFPGIAMTVAAGVGIMIMFALGTWQLDRLAWKNDLIATVERQAAAKSQPLPENVAASEWNFRSASVTGTYMHDRQILLRPRMHNGVAGVQVVTPLKRLSGSVILVNRGWAREENVDKLSKPAGAVQVTGILRGHFSKNLFTPDNNPGKNAWYWEDIPGITAAMGFDNALPVMIYDAEPGDPLLAGGQGRPNFANNHLYYACFWYVMAGVLAVFYGFIAIRRKPDECVSAT